MSMFAVLNGSHNRDTLTDARVMRIVDLNVELLILGSISLARPAWAKPGLPVLSGKEPVATTARCSTSVSRACWKASAWRAATAAMPACSRASH
jgi:hypothetical protein